MARRKIKIGDWIFVEDLNGDIVDCVVEKIEPSSYFNDKGKEIHYNLLYTGFDTVTEDYNCLSNKDKRVIEYKKTHKNPTLFIKKFDKFMKDNGFDIKSFAVKSYLSSLIC